MKAIDQVAPPTRTIAAPARLQSLTAHDRLTKLIAYIICTLVGIGYLFPLYWMLTTALKTDVEIFKFPPTLLPVAPQWQNFPASTTYIPFWLYMWNTVVICGLTIIGTVVSCALVAYGFARVRWPGRNFVFIFYLSTIMLPAQVTMIPLYIVFRRLGWYGTILPL